MLYTTGPDGLLTVRGDIRDIRANVGYDVETMRGP